MTQKANGLKAFTERMCEWFLDLDELPERSLWALTDAHAQRPPPPSHIVSRQIARVTIITFDCSLMGLCFFSTIEWMNSSHAKQQCWRMFFHRKYQTRLVNVRGWKEASEQASSRKPLLTMREYYGKLCFNYARRFCAAFGFFGERRVESKKKCEHFFWWSASNVKVSDEW